MKASDPCPQCRRSVQRPDAPTELWTGVNEDGSRAAGWSYFTTCMGCGTKVYESLDEESSAACWQIAEDTR